MFNITEFLKEYIFGKLSSFSPYPNIITMVFCVVIMLSLTALFERRDKEYRYMIASCISIFTGGFMGCVYYCLVVPNKYSFSIAVIFLLRLLYYVPMITTMFIYLLYILDATGRNSMSAYAVVFLVHMYWILIMASSQFTHIGFWIASDKTFHENYFLDIFTFAYIYYAFATEWLVMSSKHIMVPGIKINIAMVFTIFIAVDFVQSCLSSDTMVNPSMLIPLLYFLLVFRQNSYDRRDGTMNTEALEDIIDYKIKHKKMFAVDCIQIENVNFLLKQKTGVIDIQKFCRGIHYKGVVYRLGGDRLAIVEDEPDDDKLRHLSSELYAKYNKNYKGIIFPYMPIIKNGSDFRFLIDEEMRSVQEKEIRLVEPDNNKEKLQESRIIAKNVLSDIAEKCDMEDGRVRVFCQPIFSAGDKRVKTAESLMRLYVPNYGFLFPQTFIPIAEDKNYIHVLSMIIFSKVCKYISENNDIDMITVNFSVQELVQKNFVNDVINAVDRYGVQPDRIGIEITESRMESNFRSLLDVTNDLSRRGFCILLDDFGTGYSNLSKVFALPVSVIKFDRSLLLATERDTGNAFMQEITGFFKRSGKKVLCEGVETEEDEEYCCTIGMDYLQGYLYSRPVPIENLFKIKHRIEGCYDRQSGKRISAGTDDNIRRK